MATLRWGMRDIPPATDIVELQRALIGLGLYTGSADGYFGALTRSAVIAFQRDNGLIPDGVVGANTRAARQRR